MFIKPQPTVDFDPSIKMHRQAVYSFLKRKAWIDSPIKFRRDPAFTCLVTQVQTKLLLWHAEQENKSKQSKQK